MHIEQKPSYLRMHLSAPLATEQRTFKPALSRPL